MTKQPRYTQEQYTASLDKRLKQYLEITLGVSMEHYAQGDKSRAFCTFMQAQGIARVMYFETDAQNQLGVYIDKKAKQYNICAASYMNTMLDIKNNI